MGEFSSGSNIYYSVLPDDVTFECPLTDVYIATILKPQSISKAITNINNAVPIPELQHLKRVRNGDLLLCTAHVLLKCNVISFLRERGFNVELITVDIRKEMVCASIPRTRQQYESAIEHWPCNFHPDAYLQSMVDRTIFSTGNIISHKRYIEMAHAVAAKSKGVHGAVIVDPLIKSVVAVGFPTRKILGHSVLIAIDNVACTQIGGKWRTGLESRRSSDQDFNGIPQDLFLFLKDCFKDSEFGARSSSKISHNFNLDVVDVEMPYLCTNYYAYLTHEPCFMCAMALVHSRIKRVFFARTSSDGAFETICKLHTTRELNHHFEVYGGWSKA